MEIDGYRLGRKIAETELCSVHNAIDPATSKTVSVRVFHDRLTRHPGFCAGFSRFAATLKGQRAGCMVTLRQYASDPERCHAVTDYFPCLPLLQTQPTQIPVQAALQGGLEIAATLDLLHRENLVHGALRPGNLFFNERFRLTLGLGVNRPEGPDARPLPIDSSDGALFLPPEGGDGPSADWYALGICLYQQLTGHTPFSTRNMKQQLDEKRRGIRQLPDTIPADLLPLFQRLLHSNPEKRIHDASAFLRLAEDAGYTLDIPKFPALTRPAQGEASPHARASTPSTASRPAPPAAKKTAEQADRHALKSRSRRPLVLGMLAMSVLAGAALLFLLRPAQQPVEAVAQLAPPEPQPAAAPQAVTKPKPARPSTTAETKPATATPSASPATTRSITTAPAQPPSRNPNPPGDTPAPQADGTTTPPAAKTETAPAPPSRLETELRTARTLLRNGQIDPALASIEKTLRNHPQNPAAIRLRQQILDQRKIRTILQQAKEQLDAGRLSSPPGDNALESYRNLATLLPRNDPRLLNGLSRIAQRFTALSRQALSQNKLEQALSYAESGARAFPRHAPLNELKTEIQARITARQKAAQQQARQTQRQNRERALREQQLQDERARSEQISRFNQAFSAPIPLEDRIDQATQAYTTLKQLKTPVARLQPLKQRLIDARVQLSEQHLANGDLDTALQVVRQGFELGDDSGALRQQIARLQQAIEQQQRQQHADALLAEAQLLIDTADATVEDLGRASQLIQQVSTFAPDDPRIQTRKHRLLQAYGHRSNSAMADGQFDLAEQFIRQGLTLSPDDPGLIAQRQKLEQARAAEKRRSAPPPVIGTF